MEQLDLFDDDAPNAVADDYALSVTARFARESGDTFEDCTMSMGESADNMDAILPFLRDFLQRLGFTYVSGLVAYTEDGTEFDSADSD